MLKITSAAAAGVLVVASAAAQAQTQPAPITGTIEMVPAIVVPMPQGNRSSQAPIRPQTGTVTPAPAPPPAPPANPFGLPSGNVTIITTPNLPTSGTTSGLQMQTGPTLGWSKGITDSHPGMSRFTTDGQNPPNIGGVDICRVSRPEGVYIGGYTAERPDNRTMIWACYFMQDGKPQRTMGIDYLLRGPFGATSWVAVTNRQIPPNAVLSSTEAGRGAPICRVLFDKKIRAGWVGNGTCNVGMLQAALAFPFYDVLVTGMVSGPTTLQLYTSQAPVATSSPPRLDGVFNLEPGRQR